MTEPIFKFTHQPTDDPHLFRVVDRRGDWTVYFQDEKKIYLPSVNFIIRGGFPKGAAFENYLLSVSKEEAKRTLERTGDRGSRIHQAIRELIDGQTVALDKPYLNEVNGRYEPLTDEEWDCLRAFVGWCAEFKPQVIKHETSIWSEKYGFAGTMDFHGTIELKGKRVRILLDWKTGSAIYDDHKLQTAAYAHALKTLPAHTGILRLGTRHKSGYELKLWDKTETKYHFSKFLASQSNFEMTHKDFTPENAEIPGQLAVKIPKIDLIIKRPKKAQKETK